MKVRQLPGAFALGLLASIVAHTLSFGDSHEMGGSYHELFENLALIVGGAFVSLFTSFAWMSAEHTRTGSVVAASLRERLPGLPLLACSAGAWLWLIERSEPAHAPGNVLLMAAAVALASLLIRTAAEAVLRLLAAIVLAVRERRTCGRRPTFGAVIAYEPRAARAVAFSYRRFARPPPVAAPRA
ncbi:MAG TPA: hypothetical protein VME66_02280 [Candidatus Acidoferrales bacterium]|nr:hypothetical protein [Candidatus Acidoferrales bacterium]